MFKRVAPAIGLFTLLSAGVVRAQVPRLQPWAVDDLGDDSGLGRDTAFDIAFERDGDVWVATSKGLLYGDGFRWRWCGRNEGLPSDYVRCVHVSSDERLWVGTDRGAVVRVGDHWRREGLPERLARSSVRRIAEDPAGGRWFCCDRWPDPERRGGLLRLDADGAERWYQAEDGLPSDYVSDVVFDGDGVAHVLTDRGAAVLRGDRFVPLFPDGERDVGYCWDLGFHSDGRRFLLASQGLYFEQDGDWCSRTMRWSPAKGSLCLTRDGALLVGSDGDCQAFRIRERELEPCRKWYPGPCRKLETTREAPDGAVWVLGTKLLVRWDRGREEWRAYEDRPAPLYQDAEGWTWFAGSPEIIRLRPGHETERWPCQGVARVSRRGRVWAETAEGLAFFDGADFVTIEAPPTFPEKRRWVIDAEERPWLFGFHGPGLDRVAHWDGQQWTDSAVHEDALRISSLVADRDVGVWCVAVCADGDRVTHFLPTDDGIREVTCAAPELRGPAEDDFALEVTESGSVWLRSNFGAWSLSRDASSVSWQKVEGLPGRQVLGIHETDLETVWCVGSLTGGRGGVVRDSSAGREFFEGHPSRIVGRDSSGGLYFCGSGQLWVLPRGGDLRCLPTPFPGGVRSVVEDAAGDLWMSLSGQTFRHHDDGIPPRVHLGSADPGARVGDTIDLRVEVMERFRPARDETGHRLAWRWDDEDWSRFQSFDGRVSLDLGRSGMRTLSVRVRDPGGNTSAVARRPVWVGAPPLQEHAFFRPVVVGIGAIVLFLGGWGWLLSRRLRLHSRSLERTVESRTQAYRAGERRYRSLFEQSRDPVLITDGTGRILEANRAVADLLGFRASGLVGCELEDLFVSPAFGRTAQQRLNHHGELRGLHAVVRRRGGDEHEVVLTAHTLRAEDGSSAGNQWVLRDESRLEEIEVQDRQSQKLDAVGRLAGGIAHDFNNLLTVILGNAELLEPETSSAAPSESLGSIREAGERARALVGKLQTFSRGVPSSMKVKELSEVLDRSRAILEEILGPKVELLVRAQTAPSWVKADEAQLEQVLVNLASNARDAIRGGSREGRGSLQIRVWREQHDPESARRHSLPCAGGYVVLEVRDDGPGIPLDLRTRIFEPFFTTKPSSRGTGLGLSTVYGIVRHHGGAVRLGEGGPGACFEIRLPEVAPADAEVAASPGRSARGKGERLLVVEDQAAVRRVLIAMLRRNGYEVVGASSAKEAIETFELRPERVDLVLSDVVMPEMSGTALVRRLRERRSDLPVVFLSGFVDAERFEDFLPGARSAFVAKPFRTSELLATLRQVLEHGRTAELH